MHKSVLLFLIFCAITKTITAEDIQAEHATVERSFVKVVDKEVEDFVVFEFKNSEVFEDFIKSLSDSSKAELQTFINNTKQALLDNTEFAELAKSYHDLFTDLNITRSRLPKVTLTFSFDRETWVNLSVPEKLNLNSLKNSVSEDQLAKVSETLNSMEACLHKVGAVVLRGFQNTALEKEFKEKSNNQIFKIGLILA